MILELDLSILKKVEKISISQLVFLNLILNENQTTHQSVQKLISLVTEDEMLDLENRGLITTNTVDDTTVIDATDKLKLLVKEDKSMFDQFYDQFPVYVMRPDGTKGFLRANVNKCRKEYNRIIGKSKAMHQHIINCLKYEIDDKMVHGKMSYMKTMWKWLTQHEWEAVEEQLQVESNQNTQSYGTDIY